MDNIQIYKDILAESYKQEIKAKAEMRLAANEISNAKVDYIEKMIKGNQYRIEGLDYYPMRVKAKVRERYKMYLDLEVILCCKPDDIRSSFSLSKKEKELVSRYETEVYTRYHDDALVLNEPLIDDYYSSRLSDLQYLKNRIEPLRILRYEADIIEMLDEGFIKQRLELNGPECLF